MKILLVGMAPNLATGSRPDMWLLPDDSGIRHSANRLLWYAGYSYGQYMSTFDRTNLIRHPVAEKWPAAEAREAARSMVPLLRGQKVILLGRRVAAAFGLSDAPLLEWVWGDEACSFRSATVPHPSGLNRWWNEGANRTSALRFFQEIMLP